MRSCDTTTDRTERGWMTVLVILVGLGLSSPAFAAPYRHTIVMDGVNDFAVGEVFSTTTATYTAYATWDNANLYLGCAGPDIVYGNSTTWLLFYLDPDPGSGVGSSNGMLYNTQQPSFPAGFSPKYLFAWRVDEIVSSFYQFDGVSWASATNPVSAAGSSTRFVELAVPLSAIDNPAKVGIAACLVDEAPGSQTTYAGFPHNAFADGYDPDFASFYTGDFSSSRPPADPIILRVPEDFPTILAALNASFADDTVLIAAGTLTGLDNCDLDLGAKEIVIRGVHDQTILDCENVGEGLAITGGQTAALHIIDLTIIRSASSGIYIYHSSPWVEGCRVSECQSGIYMETSASKVEECEVSGNSGPGIILRESAAHIESCFIHGNTTTEDGGGIDCSGSNATIEACTIKDNTAYGSGGGLSIQLGSPTISNCEITGNRSEWNGGGLCLWQGTPTIQGCTISRNSTEGSGAGIYNGSDADPLITTSILWGNCGDFGSDDLRNYHSAYIRISCSDIDLNGVGPGTFPIQDGGLPNIFVDPLFCNMGPCGGTSGDFTLATGSACLTPSCATSIGRYGVGCTSTPVVRVTWSRLKGLYR